MSSKTVGRVAAMLLAVHGGLLTYGAFVHAPTLNEPQHLVKGLKILEEGRFDFEPDNTPLVFVLAAAPVVFAQRSADSPALPEPPACWVMFPEELPFWQRNGEHAFTLFFLGRLVCIPFSLLGGYLCFRWSRDLYGPVGGLLSLTLWTFSPNVIAHGQVITGDMGATTLGAAACYVFWKWLGQSTWPRALVAGLLLGLAVLAKPVAVVLFAAFPVLWLFWRLLEPSKSTGSPVRRQLIQLVVLLVISVDVINAAYGFKGSFQKLGSFRFRSDVLAGDSGPAQNRFAGSWLGGLPVPLPADLVMGFDRLEWFFQVPSRQLWSYLRGQWSPRGWWYFYLYALVVKVPLGTWGLVLLAIVLSLARRSYKASMRGELYLLSLVTVMLATVSARTEYTHHLRYVLPIFPFVFIYAGKLGTALRREGALIRLIAGGALAWSVLSSLWVYPHSLSYFNEYAGGPRGGHDHLVMSNIDWGQDLFYLRRWLDEHPEARPFHLAYYGPADPRLAGIEYQLPGINENGLVTASTLELGWYAISVNFLRGIYFDAPDGMGGRTNPIKDRYSYFLKRTPVGRAGFSIYIYHIDTEDSI